MIINSTPFKIYSYSCNSVIGGNINRAASLEIVTNPVSVTGKTCSITKINIVIIMNGYSPFFTVSKSTGCDVDSAVIRRYQSFVKTTSTVVVLLNV